MNSLIYIGELTHIRQGVVENSFTYPLNMYVFDLDELEVLNRNVSGFGYNRRNLISLWDSDYLTREKKSIKEKLLAILNTEGCGDNIGQIMLLTAPRYLNYVFNPMSAYYCFTPEGKLRCCLVEVNNTFGDKHVYVVDNPISKPTEEVIGHFKIYKGFHVSPFYDIKGEYEFKFSDIRENMNIQFDMNNQNDVFHARLTGLKKLPLNKSTLFKTILKYPINAWLTMPRILWQAAKLYFIKKVPFYSRPQPIDEHTIRTKTEPLKWSEKIGRRAFLAFVNRIKNGTVSVTFPTGQKEVFGDGKDPQLELRILNNRFYSQILFGGEIGFGESFVDRDWETNDLTALLVLLSQQDASTSGLLSMPKKIVDKVSHYLRRNTQKQAKKNIQDHYDIMNEMFFSFLDSRKAYSSGIYISPHDTLEKAQLNKIHALITAAQIHASDHVLEIGFGWGGFALEAVKTTGCRLTGTTISDEQFAYVKELIKQEHLEDKITLKNEDYRLLEGLYDKIVSIEMLEAVGKEYLETYFKKCEALLKPGGIFALQTITYPDENYESYRKDTDWVKKHIFPGGHLPSFKAICEIVDKTSLEVISVNKIGQSYARTLADWRDNFLLNQDKIKALGFDDAFVRKWIYYFSYCEAGFRTGFLDNYQIILKKRS